MAQADQPANRVKYVFIFSPFTNNEPVVQSNEKAPAEADAPVYRLGKLLAIRPVIQKTRRASGCSGGLATRTARHLEEVSCGEDRYRAA